MKISRFEKALYIAGLLASTVAAIALLIGVPSLLALGNETTKRLMPSLIKLLLIGSFFGVSLATFQIRRFRPLLQSTPETSDSAALYKFSELPPRLSRGWFIAHVLPLLTLSSPFRPAGVELITGATLVVLAASLFGVVGLALNVAIRDASARFMELQSCDKMQTVIGYAQTTANAKNRLSRRVLTAVAAPIALAALGAAVIAASHLRRAHEVSRLSTARALGTVLHIDESASQGLAFQNAVIEMKKEGFDLDVRSPYINYSSTRTPFDGLEEPISAADSTIFLKFARSTAVLLSSESILVALLAILIATAVGYITGQRLLTDLYFATRGINLLGSDAAIAGSTLLMRPSRLRSVQNFASAVQTLADRFHVFSEAQQEVLDARSQAIRMRGRFFASVSHDLKSPLNAIMGFSELVKMEELTDGQHESLHVIQSRSRELLALIETILDAARVEEGQLSLVLDETNFEEIYQLARDKASQLCADYPLRIFIDVTSELPALYLDRVRIGRALGTLIAYTVRVTEGGKFWLRAEAESDGIRIDVDVPSRRHSPEELENMLSPQLDPSHKEHRGLSLALRLVRAVVQLHGGSVRVIDRGSKGAMICMYLPRWDLARDRIQAEYFESAT